MNNKNIFYLLVCNLIISNINACNLRFHDDNLICSIRLINSNNNTNNNINTSEINKNKLQLLKRKDNNLKKNYQLNIKQINKQLKEINTIINNNGYIDIKNDKLDCSTISLIHSLKTLNESNDDFISSIKNRYRILNEIQYFKENYIIYPMDIMLDFDKYNDIFFKSKPYNYDNDNYKLNRDLLSIKHKVMQYEDIIANIIYSIRNTIQEPYNTNNTNNIKLVEKTENIINKVLDKLQDINKIIYDNLDLKNIHSINDILQSNSDPSEILETLVNTFNEQIKFNKSTLPIHIKTDNNDNENILNKINFKNNFVENYSNLFLYYDNSKKSIVLNTDNLNKFYNKINNKLSIQNSQNNLSLTSIVVAFFDIELNKVFHYASIIKRNDNKWVFIDSDKQYNKNNTGKLYNSLKNIFNKRILTTQYVSDDLLYDPSQNNENNTCKYKLVPILLFYTKSGYDPSTMSVSYLFNPQNKDEIEQSHTTFNTILNSNINELNMIFNEITKLGNKLKNIINNNSDSSFESSSSSSDDFYENNNITGRVEQDKEKTNKSNNNYILNFNFNNNKNNVLSNYNKNSDKIMNSLNELNSKFDNKLQQDEKKNNFIINKKTTRSNFISLNTYNNDLYDEDKEFNSIIIKNKNNKIRKINYNDGKFDTLGDMYNNNLYKGEIKIEFNNIRKLNYDNNEEKIKNNIGENFGNFINNNNLYNEDDDISSISNVEQNNTGIIKVNKINYSNEKSNNHLNNKLDEEKSNNNNKLDYNKIDWDAVD